MKFYHLPLLLLLSLISFNSFAQDREKAEEAVKKYMSTKYQDYKPVEFIEFFEQNYAESIEEKLQTKKKIKYSLIHNYMLGQELVEMEYFHLSKKMRVIGHVSFKQMIDMTTNMLLNNDNFVQLLDSIFEEPIPPSFPPATGFINDFEDILTQEQEDTLTYMVKEHEALTTNQIAIVTVTSYEPYNSLEEYTVALGNYWGIGTKEKNNGVLIALGKDIRKVWISNGDGIVPMMSNERTKEIINTSMTPEFKKGNFYLGLKKGIEAIINQLSKQ